MIPIKDLFQVISWLNIRRRQKYAAFKNNSFDCCWCLCVWKRLSITLVFFLAGKMQWSTLPMNSCFLDKWIELKDLFLGPSSQQHSSCLGKHKKWRQKKKKVSSQLLWPFSSGPDAHMKASFCVLDNSKVEGQCFSWHVLNKHTAITLGCLECQTLICTFILHYFKKGPMK